MLSFGFLEKDLGIFSPPHICIAVVCFPGSHVVNFEINLTFLMKLFLYVTKNQDKNLNILKTKKTFKVKQKASFIILKGFSAAKNCFSRA